MQDLYKYYKYTVCCILRYFKSSILTKISFGSKENLVIYSDADYTIDKSDRKSIIASISLLGEKPVF